MARIGAISGSSGKRQWARLVAPVGLVLSLLLSLTACSGGSSTGTSSTATTAAATTAPGAASTPTTAGTPASAVTPTLAPTPDPVLPAKPKAKRTQAGAEIFVRYFWAVYTYSYQALDPKPLQAISDDDCRFCKRAVRAAQRMSDGNDAILGNAIIVHRATAPKSTAPKSMTSAVTVATTISQEAGRSRQTDGTKHTLRAVKEHPADVKIRWVKGHWVVTEVNEKS